MRLTRLRAVALALAMVAAGCGASPDGETQRSTRRPPQQAPPQAPNEKPSESPATDLVLGVAQERVIAEGEQHRYRIDLSTAAIVEARAIQHGADVALRLIDPKGKTTGEIDSPNGERGLERFVVRSDQAGSYELLVTASTTGSYAVVVETLAHSDEQRILADAFARFGEAERQRRRARSRQDHERARTAYDEAIAKWLRAGDPRGAALGWTRLGQVQDRLGERRAASEAYGNAVALYRTIEEPREAALLAAARARAQAGQGRLSEALADYREALRFFLDDKDRLRAGNMLNAMGIAYRRLGETHQAREHYERALEIWRALREREREATTLTNLASIYAELRFVDLASDTVERALVRYREARDASGEAFAHLVRGRILRRRGELDGAAASFAWARDTYRDHDDESGLAIAYVGLGLTLSEAGEPDRALAALASAVTHARVAGDPSTEAFAELGRGWIHGTRLEPGAALRVDHALETLSRLGDAQGVASARATLAHIAQVRGLLDEARHQLELAIALVEQIRTGARSPVLQNAFFATKRVYYERLTDVLVQIYREKADASYAARAFTLAERARARSLSEAIDQARDASGPGATQTLLDHRVEVARTLEGSALALQTEADPVRRKRLLRTQRAALQTLRDLDLSIQEESGIRIRLDAARTIDVKAVRGMIGHEEMLLAFSLGEERSFLFLVSHDVFEVFDLPSRAEIERRAEALHGLLAVSNRRLRREGVASARAELGNLLLGPVVAWLGHQRLVVVAEGALLSLPFAALEIPHVGAGGRRAAVGSFHEVVYAPSITVAELLRRRAAQRAPAPTSLLVIADPVLGRDDERLGEVARQAGKNSRLAATGREAEAIFAGLSPAAEWRALLGFDAHRDAVLTGALDGYQVLHFATHARIDDVHPELSQIDLSYFDREGGERDGIVWGHELYRLKLTADLVTLSACQTGLGQPVRGEGLVGISHALFHAGATQVLASLWLVSDEATAELMGRFYRGYFRAGLSTAAALQQAQASMAREARWAAPYHWAGFVLLGDWLDRPDSRTPTPKRGLKDKTSLEDEAKEDRYVGHQP